ncbi:MAG: GntR family transcriptional regulator, partial [Anaeroplasmataceae bacterium]
MSRDEVYEDIKNDIIYLNIEPDTMLSETDASEKYKLSRTPIRDMFKKLEQEGLLRVVPYVGTFVSKIDLDK